jgi:hypothetical protein
MIKIQQAIKHDEMRHFFKSFTVSSQQILSANLSPFPGMDYSACAALGSILMRASLIGSLFMTQCRARPGAGRQSVLSRGVVENQQT